MNAVSGLCAELFLKVLLLGQENPKSVHSEACQFGLDYASAIQTSLLDLILFQLMT